MKNRIWARRPVALAGALALAGMLTACKESSPTPPTPVTTPPPAPVRTLIQQGGFTIGVFPAVAVATISIPATGTVEVNADWTFASSDLDIHWYAGNCSPAQATNRQCTILAQTTSVTTKPERLTISNVAAGTYTVGVASFAGQNESGNYQVYLTR